MHASPSHWLPAAALCALGAGSVAAQAPSAPQVSVGGVAYLQYVYQVKDTATHQNNFEIARAYININARFSNGVSARITPDIFRSAGGLTYRLKYAYAAWNPSASPLTLKMGMIHTPWLDWEEALWDYRMQGPMALDRNGFMSAADIGAGVDGKWGPDKVNMQVVVVNGENYNSPSTGDKGKDVSARVSARVRDTNDSSRVGGLRVTAYGQYGKPITGGERNRFIGLVSYRTREILVAAEAAVMQDRTVGGTFGGNPVTAVPMTDGHMYSAYGFYRFNEHKVTMLGRVDLFDPRSGLADDRRTRFIGGVSYQINPNLRVLADWDYLSYQTDPVPADLNRSQALFQAQLTF